MLSLMARTLLLPLVLAAMGCNKPVEAPAQVEDLSLFFFEEWDNPDPAVLTAGVDNLYAFLDTLDLDVDAGDRSFVVGGTTREEVADDVLHSLDPQETVGVGLFLKTTHSIEDYLVITAFEDQTPLEPSSPDIYTREFTLGDVDCFSSGDCETMEALNDIERRNFLYTLRYDLLKRWRWADSSDGRRALLARSTNLDSVDNGANISLLQGYSIDLYLPDGDSCIRYQVAWQQTEIPGIDDEDMIGAVANGIDDLLSFQDEWLGENL